MRYVVSFIIRAKGWGGGGFLCMDVDDDYDNNNDDDNNCYHSHSIRLHAASTLVKLIFKN